MNKDPETGEDEVMKKLKLIDNEVGNVRKDLDKHIETDHTYFKILIDAVAEIKEGNKETRKAQQEITQMTLAVKDLAVSIRDETKDTIHRLEKKVIEVEHKSTLENINQNIEVDKKISELNNKDKIKLWFEKPLNQLISIVIGACTFLLLKLIGLDMEGLMKFLAVFK